jgi:hypothetical protein
MEQGAKEIRKQIQDDLNEFTTGANPIGKARLKWLRKMGHPYGRGANAAASTPTGRKRGAGKKGMAPRLPIGQITGRLRRAKYVTLNIGRRWVITAGFRRGAKGSIYSVLPEGTKKMVSRNLWGKGEKGALGQRVKSYRKAFRDTFIRNNKQP